MRVQKEIFWGDNMKINHKRIRKCTITCCAFISALLPVNAGTAVNSGAGYTVTTTATKTYKAKLSDGKWYKTTVAYAS